MRFWWQAIAIALLFVSLGAIARSVVGWAQNRVLLPQLPALDDAHRQIERWRADYNGHRPHSSLGNLTERVRLATSGETDLGGGASLIADCLQTGPRPLTGELTRAITLLVYRIVSVVMLVLLAVAGLDALGVFGEGEWPEPFYTLSVVFMFGAVLARIPGFFYAAFASIKLAHDWKAALPVWLFVAASVGDDRLPVAGCGGAGAPDCDRLAAGGQRPCRCLGRLDPALRKRDAVF